MTKHIKFDDTSARLCDGDTVLRAFAWSRDGGQVWECVDTRGGPERKNICYKGSKNTILAEDTPRATAKHIAELCGMRESDLIEA